VAKKKTETLDNKSEDNQNSNVVVGAEAGNGVKSKLNIIIVVLLIILVGITTFVIIFALAKGKKKVEIAPPLTTEAQKALESIKNDPTANNETPVKPSSEATAEKVRESKEAVTNAQSTADKSLAYENLFQAYFDAGNYESALVSAKEYDSAIKSAYSSALVGYAYEALNNTAQAISYFKIAAERSPKPASATSNSPYNDYMVKIKQLESK